MIGQLIAASLLTLNLAHAERVEVKDLQDHGLQALAKAWSDQVPHVDDTGVTASKVSLAVSPQAWLRQVELHIIDHGDGFVEGVYVAEMGSTLESLESSVEELVSAAAWADWSAEEAQAVRDTLVQVMSPGFDHGNYLFFTGSMTGPFSGDYTHITLVNEGTGEVLSLYAGYSE